MPSPGVILSAATSCPKGRNLERARQWGLPVFQDGERVQGDPAVLVVGAEQAWPGAPAAMVSLTCGVRYLCLPLNHAELERAFMAACERLGVAAAVPRWEPPPQAQQLALF